MVKLNVGCGLDVRDGWVNVDRGVPSPPPPGVTVGDARDLRKWHGRCELVLLNHVLSLCTYDEADRVLDECAACLAPGGELVVVDADVLTVVDRWLTSGDVPFLDGLIADSLEPEPQGKLLRWACWHGQRRSLWSWESIAERLHTRKLDVAVVPRTEDDHWAGPRREESFVAIGLRG